MSDTIGTPSTFTNVPVDITSTRILAANSKRHYFRLQNTCNQDITIRFGEDAVLDEGIVLRASTSGAGGSFEEGISSSPWTEAAKPDDVYEMPTPGGVLFQGDIYAICEFGGDYALLCVVEI